MGEAGEEERGGGDSRLVEGSHLAEGIRLRSLAAGIHLVGGRLRSTRIKGHERQPWPPSTCQFEA